MLQVCLGLSATVKSFHSLENLRIPAVATCSVHLFVKIIPAPQITGMLFLIMLEGCMTLLQKSGTGDICLQITKQQAADLPAYHLSAKNTGMMFGLVDNKMIASI